MIMGTLHSLATSIGTIIAITPIPIPVTLTLWVVPLLGARSKKPQRLAHEMALGVGLEYW